jgi:hypothetical protein
LEKKSDLHRAPPPPRLTFFPPGQSVSKIHCQELNRGAKFFLFLFAIVSLHTYKETAPGNGAT